MLSHGKAFLLASAALLLPGFAQAAPILFEYDIGAPAAYGYAEVINPGDSLEFRFNVLTDLKIAQFVFSATGNSSEADVRDIKFGMIEPLTGFFTQIDSEGTSAGAFGFLDGATFMAGQIFSIYLEDGITLPVPVTMSFETTAVPLPAAGLLMAPFVVAAGLVSRRRRKAAAKA